MAIRTCDNCERTLGNLELEFSWEGHLVCGECYQRLLAGSRPVLSGIGGVASLSPQVTVLRRPKKPGVFWIAVALFAVAAIPMGIAAMGEVQDMLAKYQSGNVEDLQRLSGSGGGSIATSFFGLIVGVVNLVGFVAAWRGYGVGAWVAMVSAAIMAAMELSPLSLTGLKPTPLYVLALALMLAGFGCMLLPSAWEYYRRSAEYRKAGGG